MALGWRREIQWDRARTLNYQTAVRGVRFKAAGFGSGALSALSGFETNQAARHCIEAGRPEICIKRLVWERIPPRFSVWAVCRGSWNADAEACAIATTSLSDAFCRLVELELTAKSKKCPSTKRGQQSKPTSTVNSRTQTERWNGDGSSPRWSRSRLSVCLICRAGDKSEGEIGFSMDGNIFNSQGIHVAIVRGPSIFSLSGQKLYDLRGVNIYKLSGELVGHLANASSSEKHLDKATDKLFPAPWFENSLLEAIGT
jgi:hypothetical protein